MIMERERPENQILETQQKEKESMMEGFKIQSKKKE
jgi:hypothetical protein